MSEALIVERKGRVATLINNDPPRNRMSLEYMDELEVAIGKLSADDSVGAIVIHTTHSAGYPFQVIQTGHGREQFWLPFEPDTPTLAIRSWCSEDAAKRIAALGGQDLDELRARAERRDFVPVPLGVTVDLATGNKTREIRSANVLGVLPGSDPELKDEVVVVTAHFDHLGIGRPKNDDDIYNYDFCCSYFPTVVDYPTLPATPPPGGVNTPPFVKLHSR